LLFHAFRIVLNLDETGKRALHRVSDVICKKSPAVIPAV